jgi:hypothetical protein
MTDGSRRVCDVNDIAAKKGKIHFQQVVEKPVENVLKNWFAHEFFLVPQTPSGQSHSQGSLHHCSSLSVQK